MYGYSGRRPRYPQKRKRFRLVALVAAPVLLLALVLTLPALFSLFSGDEPKMDTVSTDAKAGIQLLSTQEAYPAGALDPDLRFDSLLLEKKTRRLTAYSNGVPVRVYLVALGENPLGPKEVEGDKKTPEGDYLINDKNPNSVYYKNLGISYPAEKDVARAQELGLPPGGDIKIHGLAPEYAFLDQAHRITNWTHGCIAVTNEEIDELYARTRVGATISIVP
ncbi:L,D-transpeptidase [Desulfovibrio sp. OttesenSCG-928-F20]|nr:L,D-transpeptidase [Desulfovibrio sp. OttesenSCG-928-M16]MDL2290540.1 L,D-transpeptidase [Desulfovibrio sp. OttesenSCG-928-F20]